MSAMEKTVLSSLLRINRYHRRALRYALAPYQYVGVMHLIVLYIDQHPGSSQEEITGFYALDKASVARDARRLEDLGHIERNKIPENRRQYKLFLTDAGRDMIRVIDRAAEQFQKSLAASISPEDWAQLELLLKRLEENVCLPCLDVRNES